jgi:hypothetical protein
MAAALAAHQPLATPLTIAVSAAGIDLLITVR